MDLELVKKINGMVGRCFPFDMCMDFIARFGHLMFILYGVWLWFSGSGETRRERRFCAIEALIGVAVASVISFGIGKAWNRPRPFTRTQEIWNFTAHKANASFPSNHTMNSAVISLALLRHHMPGAWGMAVLSVLLAFSRVYAGIHYVTDLIGGAVIAWAVHRGIAQSAVMTRLIGGLVTLSVLVEKAVKQFRMKNAE